MSKTSAPVELRFTVSGTGIEDKTYDTAVVARSAAITFASRARCEATFYVRDFDGTCVARVETDGKNVVVYTLAPVAKAVA